MAPTVGGGWVVYPGYNTTWTSYTITSNSSGDWVYDTTPPKKLTKEELEYERKVQQIWANHGKIHKFIIV